MAVTYGFYDSLAGDRTYNAKQMSQLFKGIISDGVFQTVGSGLIVSINAGMVLNVADGRAWFNSTWTDNDATITVTVLASEPVLNRIDAVVVEVDSDLAVRANSIKVIKGTPGSTPVPPTMANTATKHQYPLAYVSVLAGVTSITADKLTNKVGSVECPFATGAVPSFDFGPLLNNWQSTFTTWFNNLVNQLSGSQVTNLQAQIDVLNANVNMIDNYVITPSVSANALVFDLKTLALTNPSSANPIRLKIGDNAYSITSAVTFTKAPNTNWMNMGSTETALKEVDLFVYAILETGASAGVKFGYSRMPYAKTMGEFNNSPTHHKYIAGNWVNYNVTDNVALIGRFRAQLSGTGTFNWSIPSQQVVNKPIYETDLLSYTIVPAMGSGSGTFGSCPGSYQIIGKNMKVIQTIAITLNGTGNNGVYGSLPFTATAMLSQGAGRENAVTGLLLLGLFTGTGISYLTYSNGHPGGNGYNLNCYAEVTL